MVPIWSQLGILRVPGPRVWFSISREHLLIGSRPSLTRRALHHDTSLSEAVSVPLIRLMSANPPAALPLLCPIPCRYPALPCRSSALPSPCTYSPVILLFPCRYPSFTLLFSALPSCCPLLPFFCTTATLPLPCLNMHYPYHFFRRYSATPYRFPSITLPYNSLSLPFPAQDIYVNVYPEISHPESFHSSHLCSL